MTGEWLLPPDCHCCLCAHRSLTWCGVWTNIYIYISFGNVRLVNINWTEFFFFSCVGNCECLWTMWVPLTSIVIESSCATTKCECCWFCFGKERITIFRRIQKNIQKSYISVGDKCTTDMSILLYISMHRNRSYSAFWFIWPFFSNAETLCEKMKLRATCVSAFHKSQSKQQKQKQNEKIKCRKYDFVHFIKWEITKHWLRWTAIWIVCMWLCVYKCIWWTIPFDSFSGIRHQTTR